jgi:hypothetical protein
MSNDAVESYQTASADASFYSSELSPLMDKAIASPMQSLISFQDSTLTTVEISTLHVSVSNPSTLKMHSSVSSYPSIFVA